MVEVIDAHAHVWDPSRFSYGWLEGTALDRAMLPPDLDTADGAVTGWIFVEADAGEAEAEAEWVARLHWPGLRASIAHAELDAPDVGDTLARLAEIPRIRGIRHLLQDLPAERITSSRMQRGLQAVGHRGWAFDACVRWAQLHDLERLVRSTPDPPPVLLDHLGKPPVDGSRDSPELAAWRKGMVRLARHERVFVKLSGLVPEARDVATVLRRAPDLLRAVVDVFGPQRCVFGSDWPVSTGAAAGMSTATWIGLVRDAVGDADWPAVAGGNARRAYGWAE